MALNTQLGHNTEGILDIVAVLDALVSTRARVDEVPAPSAPGVYAWFMRHDGHLGPFAVDSERPVYIGRSISLAERVWGNHFKSGSTGWSTLRRTLGAIMKDDLALVAIPRSPSRSPSNLRHYKFDETEKNRSRSGCATTSIPVSALLMIRTGVESALLRELVPLLNLKDCPSHARTIRQMRKRCIEEAKAGSVVVCDLTRLRPAEASTPVRVRPRSSTDCGANEPACAGPDPGRSGPLFLTPICGTQAWAGTSQIRRNLV